MRSLNGEHLSGSYSCFYNDYEKRYDDGGCDNDEVFSAMMC